MQTFSAEAITEATQQLEDFFEKQGATRDAIIRGRIALEEVLLIYSEEFGESGGFDLVLSNNLGEIRAKLSVPGEAFDPFNPQDEERESLVLKRLMLDYPDRPQWRYDQKRQSNEVIFEPFSESSLPRNTKITWSYLRKYRGRLSKAVVYQALELVMQIIIPLATASLVTAYTDAVFLQIAIMITVVFALEMVSAIFYHKYNHTYEEAYHDAVQDLEEDLARSVHATNLDSVDSNGTGMFIQRMTVDTVQLISGFGELAGKLGVITKGLGMLIATLIVDWGAFLITTVSFACSYLFERKRVDERNENDIAYRKASETLFGAVTEMVRGTRDVRLLGCDKPFIANIGQGIKQAADAQLEMSEDDLKFRMRREISDIAWNFAYLAYLGVCLYFGRLSAVYAVILLNYRSSVRDVPQLVGEALQYLKEFNLSAGRIFSLMFNPEFIKESFGETNLEHCEGRIEFKNVSFSYYASSMHKRRRKVLQRLSFTVEPGQLVAFVGRSGCGKSTVLNLMERLYVPGSGSIYLDGHRLDDLSQGAIRENVVMVSQHPYVFSMSIRENLQLVKPDMTEDEMHRVCRIACVDDDFLAMPEGYDTVVGENGTSLSGGQCQRLAIARALLRNPSVLLLDEATASLDNMAQAQLFRNLAEFMRGRTVIVSSHRLSTVVHADAINYMEDGKIAASGTHEQLMESCEGYRQLYEVHE